MKIRRMPRARRAALAALAVLTLTATSCGLVRDQRENPDEGRIPGAGPDLGFGEFEEHVPALEFDPNGVHIQPAAGAGTASVAVHGPVLVHAGEYAFTAHDVVDDDRLWNVSTEYGSPEARSVVILEHGEALIAVGSYRTLSPGEGTAQDTYVQELLAVDLLSGDLLWHEVTDDADYGSYSVGLDGDVLILGGGGVWAVDVRDGGLLWSQEGKSARLVDDGVVVASAEDSGTDLYDVHRLYGLDAQTGEQVWETWAEGEHQTRSEQARSEYSAFLETDPEPGEMVMVHGSLNGYDLHRLGYAGPGRFYATASYSRKPWDLGSGGGMIGLFDTATGIADYSVNHDPSVGGVHPERAHWGEASCSFDQEGRLACWVVENSLVAIVAIDTEEGEALWADEFSPGSERRSTEPVSAWKGALYAKVEGDPIILDLEDGSDLVIDPPVAPDLTNGTIAVEFEQDDDALRVYPVTG